VRVIGVIPSRFGSSRFPGKALAPILGRPMLQWVIEGVQSSQRLDELIVATDHQDIYDLASRCGANAVMTDSELASGSDRVWAAVESKNCDVVVNIQGDEPLIQGWVIDRLVSPFQEDPSLEMATLAREFQNKDEVQSPHTAKIVLNEMGEAIYFSRLRIPHSKNDAKSQKWVCYKHMGLYAYRKSFLQKFCEHGPVALEKAEGLEQLRALYLGGRIRVVQVKHESWGVDTPEDVEKIEQRIRLGENHGCGKKSE